MSSDVPKEHLFLQSVSWMIKQMLIESLTGPCMMYTKQQTDIMSNDTLRQFCIVAVYILDDGKDPDKKTWAVTD
jgi:hypothetical protein